MFFIERHIKAIIAFGFIAYTVWWLYNNNYDEDNVYNDIMDESKMKNVGRIIKPAIMHYVDQDNNLQELTRIPEGMKVIFMNKRFKNYELVNYSGTIGYVNSNYIIH